MTYITFKENPGAGIGHNTYSVWSLIFLIFKYKTHLKYIHTNFNHKSNYYDIILQYDKLFDYKLDINNTTMNKKIVSHLNDLDLCDDNTLLIVDEHILQMYYKEKGPLLLNEFHEFKKNINKLFTNLKEIKLFLENYIDYDEDSINITLHIRRGDIMIDNRHLNIHAKRYLPNSYYVDILNQIIKLKLGKLKINLVSDGLLEEFKNDFKEFDINYVLGTDFNDSHETKKKTISYLIFNDILVTAPSGLSNICSIYSTGMLINNIHTNILTNPNPYFYKNDKKIIDIYNISKSDIINRINRC